MIEPRLTSVRWPPVHAAHSRQGDPFTLVTLGGLELGYTPKQSRNAVALGWTGNPSVSREAVRISIPPSGRVLIEPRSKSGRVTHRWASVPARNELSQRLASVRC